MYVSLVGKIHMTEKCQWLPKQSVVALVCAGDVTWLSECEEGGDPPAFSNNSLLFLSV